jgi:hypothetical protein
MGGGGLPLGMVWHDRFIRTVELGLIRVDRSVVTAAFRVVQQAIVVTEEMEKEGLL